MADFPTPAAIERELDDIWPGWVFANGEPVHRALRWSAMPVEHVRRVKWLLMVHKLHRQGKIAQGWGAAVHTTDSGKTYAHALLGRGYRAEDEPSKVGPLPASAGAPVAPRSSPAAIAIATRLPLPVVVERLKTCPPGQDPEAWVRGGTR